MLKRITADDLRVGMYINDLSCGWLDHPFALNKFLIKSEIELKKIKVAGVISIEIDTKKGLDVVVEKRKQSNLSLRQAVNALSDKKPELNAVKAEFGAAKLAFNEAELYISGMMTSAKMGQHVELEEVNPVINKLCDSVLRNHNALLGLTRIRNMDQYTFEHSVSFSVLMMSFAKSMGESERFIRQVGIGGLLHDIGKTMTPDHILNKAGKLTADEFLIMKDHVVQSRLILEKTAGLSQVSMDVAAMHHEKYDGNGYPRGLKGDEISLAGQMAAIVDVYDALTADRCYHVGREPSEALKYLLNGRGQHFSPLLVQKFIQSVGIYPAGCLVLLNNHHLAIVIEVKENMLKPIVEIFLNTRNRSYVPNKLIDLSSQTDLKIKSVENFEKWNLKPDMLKW
ncbi:HD-GYP domain-containing protein [Psychromonas sp.]|nr:HD-GYP domain-containing protein [Psychromonas sp.]